MGTRFEYLDISPPISQNLAVFPGDLPFRRDISMDFSRGDHLGLSSINTTLHIGAHVDAPNHYNRNGSGIDERDLNYYLGRCQVIEVRVPRGSRIFVRDLPSQGVQATRVLFKTGSFENPLKWNSDFNSLSPELIDFLKSKGVVLIGIDTPSIDPAEDKILESHNAVFFHDMAILEGIVLDHVPPGTYTLVALPLRLKGADASPVRAILLNEKEFLT